MQVIYRPKSYPDGSSDPAVNMAYGRKWQANIPQELTERDTVLQLLVEPDPLVTGKTRGVERHIPIFEACRGNPSFEIVGAEKRKPGRKAAPKTADEYRSHALAWMNTVEDADDLALRWQSEAELRASCGIVSDEDLEAIRPDFERKYHQLNPDGSSIRDPKWAQMTSDADAA